MIQSSRIFFLRMRESLDIGWLAAQTGCVPRNSRAVPSTARCGGTLTTDTHEIHCHQGRQQAGWVSPAQSQVTMGGPNLVPPAPLLFLLFLLYKEYMKAIENDTIGILHRCFKIINYIMPVKDAKLGQSN